MITEITKEQEDSFPEYVRKGIAIGTCTRELDMEKVTEAVQEVYRCGGQEPPESIEVVDSPYQLVEVIKKEDPELWEEDKNLFCFGQHDIHWIIFYETLREQFNQVEQTKSLSGLSKAAREMGWFAPFTKVCLVSRKPKCIHLDENNVLHSFENRALEFVDGNGVCAVHGVVVPDRWVLDQGNLTAKEVLEEPNLEVRQAGCQILGWEKIIEELEPTVIDTDEDPEIGQLLEVVIPDSGRERFLRVRCGTGRYFVLQVPLEVTTAREANAATYGLKPDEYHPEVRT